MLFTASHVTVPFDPRQKGPVSTHNSEEFGHLPTWNYNPSLESQQREAYFVTWPHVTSELNRRSCNPAVKRKWGQLCTINLGDYYYKLLNIILNRFYNNNNLDIFYFIYWVFFFTRTWTRISCIPYKHITTAPRRLIHQLQFKISFARLANTTAD